MNSDQPPRVVKRPMTLYPDVQIDPKRQIRVLTLLPWGIEDVISCTLKIRDLKVGETSTPETDLDVVVRGSSRSHQAPSGWNPRRKQLSRRPVGKKDATSHDDYCALSYAWGSWVEHRTIELNGKSKFPVTRNLWAALRRLRDEGHAGSLWVDQICINQDSIPERNDQVRIMGDVYRLADHVFVWLGETTGEYYEIGSRRLHKYAILSRVHSLGGLLFNPSYWSIRDVLLHVEVMWHTRAWVIQENVLASRSTIYFGSEKMDWARVSKLTTVPAGTVIASLALIAREIDVQRYSSTPCTILDYMCVSALTQCSDPRDKVYSLLAIISPRERSLIQVDYVEDVARVFTEATYANITTLKNLAMMCLVRSAHPNPVWKIPTWVLDSTFFEADPSIFRTVKLRGNTYFSPLKLMLALFRQPPRPWLRTRPSLEFGSKFDPRLRSLSVTGLTCDTIVKKISLGHSNHLVATTRGKSLRQVLANPHIAASHNAADVFFQPWGWILSGPHHLLVNAVLQYLAKCSPYSDRVDGAEPPAAPEFPDMEYKWEVAGYLTWMWGRRFSSRRKGRPTPGVGRGLVNYRWFGYFQCLTAGYCMFVTGREFLVFGPVNAAEGDIVVLPYGNPLPLLLHPSAGRMWKFVSFVYVFGIMEDELAASTCCLRLDQGEFMII